MDAEYLRSVADFAVKIARKAGELTLRYFKPDTPVEHKADNTPVTIADRSAEQLLRERIARTFPTHGILGEEFGEKPGREPARWILDPIDGTFSFICGVPLYSVLIGFEWEGQMLAGVIHLPALNETLWAARGMGSWWNDKPARVSGVAELANARISTGSLKLIERHKRGAEYERLRSLASADRGWPDAYAYALLATGRVDIVLDPIMSIWDTAALAPVVTEAGGSLTDWKGVANHAAPEALGTNGHLLEATLAALNSASETQRPRKAKRGSRA